MSDSDTITTRDSLPSLNATMSDLSLNTVAAPTTPTTNNNQNIANTATNVTTEKAKVKKVDILLNATGNVPILKTRKWAVEADKTIGWVIRFVHKYLKLDPEEKLFLYVNQTFAPSPDQVIKNLYDCYGTNGKLILYYCKSQAWG